MTYAKNMDRTAKLNAAYKEGFADGQRWVAHWQPKTTNVCQLLNKSYPFLKFTLPIRAEGVYFLLKIVRHSAWEIIYIGQSDNILQRIGTHAGNSRLDFDYVGWFRVVGGEEQRRKVENDLIKKHLPRMNVRGKPEQKKGQGHE